MDDEFQLESDSMGEKGNSNGRNNGNVENQLANLHQMNWMNEKVVIPKMKNYMMVAIKGMWKNQLANLHQMNRMKEKRVIPKMKKKKTKQDKQQKKQIIKKTNKQNSDEKICPN